MSRLLRVVAVLVLLAGTSACSLTIDATTLGVPATLASDAAQPAQGTPFKVRAHATYAFWGVLKVGQPSVGKMLAQQLVGGKSVADVRVRVQSRFSDLLFTVLTAGVLVPRTVEVEGVVVGQ